MFTVETITDFEDPRLAPYRNLRAQGDHLDQGVFIAEGEKITRRLVESPHGVASVIVSPKWEADYRTLLAARPDEVPLFVAPEEIMARLTGLKLIQGAFGVGRVPAPTTLEDLLALPCPRLFTAVDVVMNAVNIGLVLRNAVALGVQALIVGETSAHPYLRRSVRTCMGTAFKIPYHLSDGLVATLHALRTAGVRCLAAHPHTRQRLLPQADLAGDCCIVLGSESEGIRPEVRAACDEAVAIPMQSGVDSLNVGNASAVFFYEAWRQRNGRT